MQETLKRTFAIITLIGVVGAAGTLVNLGTAPGRADEAKGAGYLPGLGDLMNASMQVHHTKLWFAGHADNWDLAAYELKEIKETVEDIRTVSPNWHDIPVGQMVTVLNSSLDALEKAVAAKDPVKFDAAYHELTAACNGCHEAAKQPEIKVIEPPPQGGGPYADQVFTAGSGPQ